MFPPAVGGKADVDNAGGIRSGCNKDLEWDGGGINGDGGETNENGDGGGTNENGDGGNWNGAGGTNENGAGDGDGTLSKGAKRLILGPFV